MRQQDINYILSVKEFILLAASVPIAHFYGPDLSAGAMEEEEMLSCLWGMTQKGIVLEHEGRFRAAEPYATLFLTIKNAAEIWSIRHSRKELSVKCIYFGKENWMIENDSYAPSRIRCRRVNKEEITDILYAQEYLPHLLREEYQHSERFIREETEYADESKPLGDYMGEESAVDGERKPSGDYIGEESAVDEERWPVGDFMREGTATDEEREPVSNFMREESLADDEITPMDDFVEEEELESAWQPSGGLEEDKVILQRPGSRLVIEKRERAGDSFVPVRQLAIRRDLAGYRMERIEDGRRRQQAYDLEGFRMELERL